MQHFAKTNFTSVSALCVRMVQIFYVKNSLELLTWFETFDLMEYMKKLMWMTTNSKSRERHESESPSSSSASERKTWEDAICNTNLKRTHASFWEYGPTIGIYSCFDRICLHKRTTSEVAWEVGRWLKNSAILTQT